MKEKCIEGTFGWLQAPATNLILKKYRNKEGGPTGPPFVTIRLLSGRSYQYFQGITPHALIASSALYAARSWIIFHDQRPEPMKYRMRIVGACHSAQGLGACSLRRAGGHRRLIDQQPVKAHGFYGVAELIEVHRLLDIAICAQPVALHEVALLLRRG